MQARGWPSWLNLDASERWDRFAIVAMTMVGAIVGIAQVARIAPLPGDAANYWLAGPGEVALGGYVFPPVLTQVIAPIRATDLWWVFDIAWTTLCFASLGYVLGRWAYVAAVLVIPELMLGLHDAWWAGPIAAVLIGNVTMPMVAAIIAGMRRPAWWSVPLLTKLTPGVGVLWFAFRADWRRFGVALGVTAAIAVASFAIDPAAWFSFARFAIDNLGATHNGPAIVGPPLAIRLPAAVLLVAIGARASRPRLVPVACAVAVVGLYGTGTFMSIAVAALSPRLGRGFAAADMTRGSVRHGARSTVSGAPAAG